MVIIGANEYGRPVEMTERVEGTYIVGKTRMGKTTLLLSMICQDIAAGEGVCVIDAHGDLVRDVIARLPKERYGDVILFDAGCDAFPPGFDIFAPPNRMTPATRSLHINRAVDAFEKTVGSSWGVRLENLIRLTAITFLDNPGNTLTEMDLLVRNTDFRQWMLARLTLPEAREHWESLDRMSDAALREYTESTMTRIRRFIYDPLIRTIVGQVGAGIDFRRAMDNRKIVLVTLPSGKIHRKNVDMLGTFIVDRLLAAAMSREEIPFEKRIPFHVYADEFQRFATPDFGEFFTEAGKYRIALIVAHQVRSKLTEDLNAATLAANNQIIFTAVPDDARTLARGLDAPEGMGGLPPWREDEYEYPEPPPPKPIKAKLLPAVVPVPERKIAPAHPRQAVKQSGHPDTDIALGFQRIRQAFSLLMRRKIADVYASHAYYEEIDYGRSHRLVVRALELEEEEQFEEHWNKLQALEDQFLGELGRGETTIAWNRTFRTIRARAHESLVPDESEHRVRTDAGREYLEKHGNTTAAELLSERYLKELEALGRRYAKYYEWEEPPLPEPDPEPEPEEEPWDPDPEYRPVDLSRALHSQPRFHAFAKVLQPDGGIWQHWIRTPHYSELPPIVVSEAEMATLMEYWHRRMGLPGEKVEQQIAARRKAGAVPHGEPLNALPDALPAIVRAKHR